MDTPLAPRWFVTSPRPLVVAVLAHVVIAALMFVPMPSSGGPPSIPHLDKLVHMACWAALAFASWWAFARSRFLFTVVSGALFGVLVELGQGLTTTRSADPWDALADLCGALLGALAAYAFQRSKSGDSR